MKQLTLYIFFVMCISVFGQHTDTITWRQSYRLTWDDFKAPPEEGQAHGAITNAIILYDAKSNGPNVECTVLCYFNRQRSWVKNNSRLDYVLRHEQGHFDIQEIYARKLRKLFKEHTFQRKSFNKDCRKLFDKISKQVIAQQKKYDKATGFAFKEKDQKKWLEKITEDLKDLEEYKNLTVTLTVK